jgi:hypothetical protein
VAHAEALKRPLKRHPRAAPRPANLPFHTTGGLGTWPPGHFCAAFGEDSLGTLKENLDFPGRLYPLAKSLVSTLP